MDHGGRGHHTAAMGPPPWRQSTQQSTNIICEGSTLLKLEKKLFITSNITINACRVNVDKRRRWCGNATMGIVQPTGQYCQFQRHIVAPNDIFNEGWRRGEGGGGCGGVICPQPRVSMGTQVFFLRWHDSQWSTHHTSNKKYGTHMMLIWY